MSWDLETAKRFLGIVDDTQDTIIQDTLDDVLSDIELMLQRKLLLQRSTVKYTNYVTDKVLLPRFPVVDVHSVDGAPMDDLWYVHNQAGWIELPSYQDIKSIEVDYTGGYDPLPESLERAMWEAFMTRWGNTDPDTGAPAGAVQGDAEMKAITVYDGFKMEFHDSSTSSSSSGGVVERELQWGWLAPWASVFQMYRSEHGVGVGFA